MPRRRASPSSSPSWDPWDIAACAIVGMGASLLAAPSVVSAIGFKNEGIAAGSLAADMMRAGMVDGKTESGSAVSGMQTVGAKGSVLAGPTSGVVATAAIGAAVGAAAYGGYRLVKQLSEESSYENGNGRMIVRSKNHTQ